MARMTLKCGLDQDKDAVLLQIEEEENPVAHMFLDGASAETVIHDIARYRAMLSEQVSPTLDPGSRLEFVADPVWRLSERSPCGRILTLRHPGFGWLAFAIPDKEAASIADLLAKDPPQNE